jgi:membrane protease YdiL (CAAX protease family)
VRTSPVPAALAVALSAAGCFRPVATARTSRIEPPAAEEIEARVELDHRACTPNLAFLFPGLGQLCLRRGGQGALMASVAAAEIGSAIAVGVEVEDAEHPGVALPLLAVQDLWVYGVVDVLITRQRAAAELYVPRDSPADLVLAPFNLEVMKRPSVWAGLAVALAAGIGLSIALADEEDLDPERAGDDPNLFGETVDGRYGYPLGFAAGAGLFTHVALTEEALFRGYIQSSMARTHGETVGWVGASLGFGAAHILNVVSLEEEDRGEYLLYGLPAITAIGFYLGWLYRHGDYSLAPPTAVHFWYDFLLTGTFFVLDPENSIFSTRIAFPF